MKCDKNDNVEVSFKFLSPQTNKKHQKKKHIEQ